MMTLAEVYALAEVLLLVGAGLSLLFLVAFLWRARWWRSLTGAAILVSATALALLLNLEIALALIGADEFTDAVVTTVVLAVIDLGIVFKIAALGWGWWQDRKAARTVPPLP